MLQRSDLPNHKKMVEYLLQSLKCPLLNKRRPSNRLCITATLTVLKMHTYGDGEKIWSWGVMELNSQDTEDLGDNENTLDDAVMTALCGDIFIQTQRKRNPYVNHEL